MITKSLLLTLLLAAVIQSQSKVGYAQHGYPDVIKCGDYFYFLQRSTPNFSRYNVFTGTSDIVESYDAIKGVLSNKVGKLPGNCENESLESLWAKNRAFRIFNLDRAPNRSLANDNRTPDVIQCEHGILMYILSNEGSTKQYRNPTGPIISYISSNNSLGSLWGIGCGKTSLNNLIANKQTYNIATQLVSSSNLANSMVGNYPDLLKCQESTLFLTGISADKQWATYRGPTPRQGITEIKFQNGRYKSAQRRGLLSDCTYKSMSSLISQGKAFNINTPVLKCPSDITSDTSVVQFQATQTGNLSLSYSHKSKSTFPIGKTTNVTVTGTQSNSDFTVQCTFGVTIRDIKPPSVTCPQNIRQRDRVAYFSASATDDVTKNVKFNYSQASGTEFAVGETIVTFTASDEAGNQAKCTFSVVIDQLAPTLACPANISQKEGVVQFAAQASDNSKGIVKLVYSRDSGSQFQIGETLVIVTAIDDLGNQSQCMFSVIIDSEPPSIKCPADITSNDQVVSFAANANDNEGQSLRILYSQAPGSKFALGDTQVTVTATDGVGNKNQCKFNVKVVKDGE